MPKAIVEWQVEDGRHVPVVDGHPLGEYDTPALAYDALMGELKVRAGEQRSGRLRAVLYEDGRVGSEVMVRAPGEQSGGGDEQPVVGPDQATVPSHTKWPFPGRLRRPWLIPVALVAVLVVLGAGAQMLRGGAGQDVAVITGEAFPGTAPLEWTDQARWRTPVVLAEAGRVLVVRGQQVAFVTKNRQVALVDADTGQTRWSAPYGEGKPLSALALTRVEGKEVIAAQVGQRLSWWELASGESGGVDVPGQATVTFWGSAPLASVEGKAWIVSGDQLAPVTIPSGATAYAARADGTVTAASGTGWWHLKAGQEPGKATPWEVPVAGGVPQPVAYLEDTLIALLPTSAPERRQVVVYSDRDTDVRYLWMGEGQVSAGEVSWTPSPSRRWGIFGRTLIDNLQGRAVDLGAWTTTAISADRAEGRIADKRVMSPLVRPVPLGEIAPNESFPEDLTSSGALVRADLEAGEALYLLPPNV